MKYVFLFLFVVGSCIGFSQDDNINPEIAQETQNQVATANSAIDQANTELEKAQKAYQDAQKEAEKARAEQRMRDNELEQARMQLRQANLAVARATKAANPIVIERYNVPINPIFEEMSKGNQYGLATFIEGAETSGLFGVFSKNVDKEFKNYIKQFSVGKTKKQKGELFFDNIIIPQMSSTAMDMYVDFVEQDNGVSIRTYFDMGGQFLDMNDSSDPAVQYAERLMDEFARYMRTKNLEEEISALEKNLDNNYKDLEKAKKDISDSKEVIQDAENTIAESRNSITNLENEIDDMNDKLEVVRLKLSKVN